MSDGPSGRGAVVVLSWNGHADTMRCVESLRPGAGEYDVLVVDNGSYDRVLDDVAARWPSVGTLQTGENLGYAGGMNAGIRWAMERGAAFVTVLNNDTIVPDGAVDELQLRSVGGRAVSPRIDYLADPKRIWFAQGAIDPATKLPHHVAVSDAEAGTASRPTVVLTGCCITAETSTWQRVGLFDERFFLDFEDSEWSVRAGRAGVALTVEPDIRIGHQVSAAFTRETAHIGTYYYARNGLLFNRLMGGGAVSRWRFLRRHVLPDTVGRYRMSGFQQGTESAWVVVVAVFDYIVRRFGRARRSIERVDSFRRRKSSREPADSGQSGPA